MKKHSNAHRIANHSTADPTPSQCVCERTIRLWHAMAVSHRCRELWYCCRSTYDVSQTLIDSCNCCRLSVL